MFVYIRVCVCLCVCVCVYVCIGFYLAAFCNHCSLGAEAKGFVGSQGLFMFDSLVLALDLSFLEQVNKKEKMINFYGTWFLFIEVIYNVI